MTLRYLLDTNVLSEPLHPRPSRRLETRLRRHADTVATASIVWHEHMFGCCRLPESERRRTLERYLDEVVGQRIPILGYDARAAAWHARERARLVARGIAPPFVDGQIAAIAAVNALVLVSRNTRDFRAFEGLRVESWS